MEKTKKGYTLLPALLVGSISKKISTENRIVSRLPTKVIAGNSISIKTGEIRTGGEYEGIILMGNGSSLVVKARLKY